MRQVRRSSRAIVTAAVLASMWGGAALATEQRQIPDNIGGGLRQLLDASTARHPDAVRPLRDQQDRVLVNVWLDGKRSSASVHQALIALGSAIQAELPTYRHGVIAAYLPLDRAIEAARLPGVKSLMLDRKPTLRIGKATSQGVATIHADQVNALGFTGAGITIAALSDSYDTVKATPAKADVKSGDLPGPGNPNGNTAPVLVLDEDPVAGTDEGRGLLQIIFDIAPKSHLCFATAFTGEVQFAVNILKLADKNGPCKADVIDDDVGYSQEPFFSDGVVAAAVDQVVADGVAYFSSAGNDNSGNYTATFNPVTDGDARTKYAGNLKLDQVPKELTAGGFHNFGSSKNVSIAMTVNADSTAGFAPHFLDLQWDDPFDDGAVTASYSFLVFDADGTYEPSFSGADNNISTDEPIQGASIAVPGTANQNFQIVIAQRSHVGKNFAKHLKWIDFDDGDQVTLVNFGQKLAPSVYGHPAAAGAIAVAADFWNNTLSTEYYSSLGPTEIDFDGDNIRLATPEIRKKPEIAAPDGVDTTFFGDPGVIPNDPNPVFFGTSAAAPHAAGAAALLIQAAGGSGKLTPARIRALLQATTQQPHQRQAGTVAATLASGGDTLSLTVTGFLPNDPKQFHLAFTGATGDSLVGLKLNATSANITFGDKTDQYLVGPTNVPTSAIHYTNAKGSSPIATFTFNAGAFKTGGTLDLGLDVDDALLGGFGINSGLLYGTTVTASFKAADGTVTKVSTPLTGLTGVGYSVADGAGLIDAFAAYQKLKGVK